MPPDYCREIGIDALVEPWAGAPGALLDAISPALETGGLGSNVIRAPARHVRPCRLRGGELGLAGGPAMALELILPQLLLTLAVLGIRDELRRARRRPFGLEPRRRTYRFVLIDRAIPAVISVVRVIIRNAVPPQSRVIQRQGGEIQTQPEAAPTPRPPVPSPPAPPAVAPPAPITAAIAAAVVAEAAMAHRSVAAAARVLRKGGRDGRRCGDQAAKNQRW